MSEVWTMRSFFQQVAAVFRFEMRRTRTASRWSAWMILIAFPPVIMGIFRLEGERLPDEIWGIAMYLLAAQATPLLGLLLWVAPAIQVELEGRTWSYVAVRPGGKMAVLFGKYLNGIAWTLSAGALGLLAATLVGRPGAGSAWKLFVILLVLQSLGVFAYGALYLMLGTLLPRRAMVIAVAYTLVFEVVVSLIPATINQITVQHRLWNLLWTWMSWPQPRNVERTLSEYPSEVHLGVLIGYTMLLLAIACYAARRSEYVGQSEV